MMRIHILQHAAHEGAGTIAEWAEARGHQVRVSHVYLNEALPEMAAFDWLVVMGGPMNIYEEAEYPWLHAEKAFLQQVAASDKRVLAVCLGAQLMADALGADVVRNAHQELGWHPLTAVGMLAPPLSLLLQDGAPAFHWHGDRFELPQGATLIAASEACAQQGFTLDGRIYAFQFHPEVTPALAEGFIQAETPFPSGPYIQAAADMLADAGLFERARHAMFAFLDALALQAR